MSANRVKTETSARYNDQAAYSIGEENLTKPDIKNNIKERLMLTFSHI